MGLWCLARAQLEPSPHSPEPAQPLAGLTSASRVQTQAHWPWPGCPGSRWGAVQENVGGSAHWTHRKEQVRAPLGRWGPAAAGSPGPPEAVQPPGRALAALPSPASRASSSPPLASPGSACPPGFPDKRRPCGFISLPLYLWLPPPAPSVLPFLPRELIHTAWDPTPRPDFLWSWPGQPRGSREAVTWPQSLQAEPRSEMGFATCGDFAQGTLGTAWGHSWWPERGSPGTGRAEDWGSAERHAARSHPALDVRSAAAGTPAT